MWRCHYCSLSLSAETQRKHQLCPGCGSDIHSCKNCTNYDESVSHQCQESNSPWLSDRSGPNECPFFEFRASSDTKENSNAEAEKAKEAFRALFRNP